ncbi:hypothetical protein DL93DRAFT_1185971 [Clavulina sp. PMI_390]|nr:hypothetical protein DL93DRAFT_1185971 [Clavulina sp. PMI_390]
MKPRTETPLSMPILEPETLLPVLDYSSDVSRPIPKNPLSFRAISAFLLERSDHLLRASLPSVNQLSCTSLGKLPLFHDLPVPHSLSLTLRSSTVLQRTYDSHYLQRTLGSTKAAAAKLGGWLGSTPSSILKSLAQPNGSEFSVHSSLINGHKLGEQSGASPPPFHAPLVAEHESSRGTPYQSTSTFPQAPLSSVPPSPHGGGQGFAHLQNNTPQISSLDSSDAAGLLLAHSALCAANIRLQLAGRNLLPHASHPSNGSTGNNAEYYRPSSAQSHSSFQTLGSSRPISPQASYPGPHAIRSTPTNSAVFVNYPSSTISPASNSTDSTPWPMWNGLTGNVPNQAWTGSSNVPQYPNVPLHFPPNSLPPQPQSEPPLISQSEIAVDHASLAAAGEIAELAMVALRLPAVFAELDMMIRVSDKPWLVFFANLTLGIPLVVLDFRSRSSTERNRASRARVF